MPDENLLATLEQGLRQSRATRSRLAARLADLEAEAERVRTELNEMDAIISQTEAAMFRILSSSFSAQAGPASDLHLPPPNPAGPRRRRAEERPLLRADHPAGDRGAAARGRRAAPRQRDLQPPARRRLPVHGPQPHNQ